MKKIILSYDYELFFGDKSGTVRKTLIEPTNLLMETMERYGFRGDFFVDALMLKYLKNENTKDTLADYELIKLQLKDMISRGHRIELHIHPHWIDAKYKGDGTWDYSEFCHYSLNSFEENDIIKMFEECVDILQSIAREIDPEYKLCAFRAGGWAVQPFNKLRKAFVKTDIIIDSSTSKGIYNFLKESYYDFRSMPDKTYYFFDEDVCIEKDKGKFIEVPITSVHTPFLLFLYNKYFSSSISYPRYADGTHFRASRIYEDKSFFCRIKEKLNPNKKDMLSLTYHKASSLRYFARYDKRKLHCFIEHPKDISKGSLLNIKAIEGLYESIHYVDLLR